MPVVSQGGPSTVSCADIVIAPFLARPLPRNVPPSSVMLVSARIFPTKVLLVPIVAEEPTCQYTLHPLKPFSQGGALCPKTIFTMEFVAVVRVLPIWKTHCESGFPCASSVRVPVNPAEDEKQWTPGPSLIPPRSLPVRSVPHGAP